MINPETLARLVSQVRPPAQRGVMNPNLARIGAAPRVAGVAAARPETGLGFTPVDTGFDYSGGGRSTREPSALSTVGRGLMNVLRVVDKPRAAVVSTLQELEDLRRGEGFSVSDWREQLGRNIGFQEVLDKSGMPGGWQRTALGFVGDVATDPLTYLTGGTSAIAKGVVKGAALRTPAQIAADNALNVAVRTGSSKMIADSLAKSAVAAGLVDDAGRIANPAVERLLVSAAERGRGALTPKQLAQAGVTDDVVRALNLPEMQKTFGVGSARVTLPGRGVANVTEGLKGELKRSFRLKPGAKVLRDKFIPEAFGTRALTQQIYDASKSVGDRAAAVLARTSVNSSLVASRLWASDTAHRVQAALNKEWYSLDDDAARVATANIEAGVPGVAEDAVRTEFKRIRDELVDAGVELGDLGDNYIPHVQTEEFRNLTRTNASAREFAVKNLRTEEGFQRVRSLRAGDSFFDELFGDVPLQTGTIAEINERALAGFGVKLFKDDVRDIIPFYIKSSGEALQRAKQIEALANVGLAREVADTIVKKANTDPKYLREVASVQKALNKARLTEQVELRRGGQIRRDAIPQAIATLRASRVDAAKQIRKLENEIRVTQRNAVAAQDKLVAATNKVEALRTSRESLERAIPRQRGAERARLRGELARVEKQLVSEQKLLDRVQAEVDQVLETQVDTSRLRTPAERAEAARRVKSGAKAINYLNENLRTLSDEAAEITRDIDDLFKKRTPFGEGTTLAENQLRNSQKEWELLLKAKSDAVDASDAAAGVFALVQAGNPWAIDQVQRVIADLDRALAATGGLGATRLPAGVQQARLMDLKQRMDTVLEVLRRMDGPDVTPETRLIASLEAAAAASDLAALQAGNTVRMFEQMLDALNNKKFIDVVERAVEDGMVAVGRNMQIPGWLDQALSLKRIADEAPEISRYLRKYYNLFKGYAILRPGFHVRNLYSAMFNMYLEAGAGSLRSADEFFKFFRLVERNPETYMDEAVKMFGPQKAERLRDAWAATAGSGAGQIAGELTVGSLRRGGFNPFSEEFFALKQSRRFGEFIENRVRGAHAYDVLNRGGTVEQALDVLNKWQFNYTDLTTFDQKMKLINPFWVFFSRNIALQAQEWVRAAPRLNRSVENFRRNVGYDLEDDANTPEWFQEAGAIPLGRGKGGMRYLFTDLPAVVWPGEIGELTDPSEMSRLIGTAGPWISIPYELASGRQAFSGIPIKDVYEPLPAPLRYIPGIGALPFVEQGARGPMMTAASRSVLMSALPGLGQAERLFPAEGTAAAERQAYSGIAYLTGIAMRENTPRSQRGEQYRRLLEEAAEQRKRESLR